MNLRKTANLKILFCLTFFAFSLSASADTVEGFKGNYRGSFFSVPMWHDPLLASGSPKGDCRVSVGNGFDSFSHQPAIVISGDAGRCEISGYDLSNLTTALRTGSGNFYPQSLQCGLEIKNGQITAAFLQGGSADAPTSGLCKNLQKINL